MLDLDAQILHAVEEIPGIAVLLLFGSRAKGTARPDSDLDIAVLPDAMVALDDATARRRLQTRVAVALAGLAPEGRVDVVFLDEATDVLRQRVMEHSRILICRDREAWIELRVRTMREYGDREWARLVPAGAAPASERRSAEWSIGQGSRVAWTRWKATSLSCGPSGP